MRFDVRRFAAIDMYGTKGSRRRQRVVRAEFLFGAVGSVVLGLVTLSTAHGGRTAAVGAWLVGAGLNYVPLAAHAVSLSRPGALQAELAGVDVRRELLYYSRAQLWVAVPLAVVLFATRDRRQRASS